MDCCDSSFTALKQVFSGRSRNVAPRWPGEYRVDFGEKFETRIFLSYENPFQPLRPFARVTAFISGKDQSRF